MANEDIFDKVMTEVMKKINLASNSHSEPAKASNTPNNHSSSLALNEFVGASKTGETIGIVIPNVDGTLLEKMKIAKKYRSIGIIGDRTGAGPQIFSADEAVKATNSEVLSIELPRDTMGGAGHGSLIIFGAEDVSDARRAVEVTLNDIDRTFGDVYANEAGHLEFQFTARAAQACNLAFGAPIGKAFGITVGAPAAIGVMMVDTAVKSARVDLIGYASPGDGTSFSNEAIGFYSGDPGAVRQAILSAREVGLQLLGAMGDTPQSATTPYI